MQLHNITTGAVTGFLLGEGGGRRDMNWLNNLRTYMIKCKKSSPMREGHGARPHLDLAPEYKAQKNTRGR